MGVGMSYSKFMVSAVLFISFAQAESIEQECRKRAEKLLYEKGYINENVCLDLSKYPNLAVNHDYANIKLGDDKKKIDPQNLDSMANLSNLMNEMIEEGDKSSTEVSGYTDGVIAIFSSQDSQFTSDDVKLTTKKEVTDYDTDIPDKKITVSRQKKLDEVKYKAVLDRILDPVSKAAIQKAYADIPEVHGKR
jgi:hypothetical protein